MDQGISRRSFLTTAGVVIGGMVVTGLAACTESVPVIPEPSPSPTGPIRNQLEQALTTISAGNPNFEYPSPMCAAGTATASPATTPARVLRWPSP